MFRIFFTAIGLFAAASLITPDSASAHWWNKVAHSISHTVQHAASKVASGAANALHDAERDAKAVSVAVKAAGNYAKAKARQACEKAVPVILEGGIGKACNEVAGVFATECNGALDAETAGFSVPACTGGAVAIAYECRKGGGKFARPMISSATHEICSKI